MKKEAELQAEQELENRKRKLTEHRERQNNIFKKGFFDLIPKMITKEIKPE